MNEKVSLLLLSTIYKISTHLFMTMIVHKLCIAYYHSFFETIKFFLKSTVQIWSENKYLYKKCNVLFGVIHQV